MVDLANLADNFMIGIWTGIISAILVGAILERKLKGWRLFLFTSKFLSFGILIFLGYLFWIYPETRVISQIMAFFFFLDILFVTIIIERKFLKN